jgi:hypothetical protein
VNGDMTPALTLIDVQDSFVLGFERHGPEYWLRALFSLTPEHDAYSPPLPNEYACYRHGWLKARGVTAVKPKWNGMPTMEFDGEVDFGSIERVSFVQGLLVCVGEWGEVRVTCADVVLALDAD